MRILVCEFVTGGGMPEDHPIPAGLAHEGDLMLRALLGDLLEVPGVEVVATRDARLPPLPLPIDRIPVAGVRQAWSLWKRLAEEVDAVWPIAPESGGALERLSRLVCDTGSRLLNSHPDAVAIAASKVATAQVAAAAGLPVVPAWPVGDLVDGRAPGNGPWVVKPDDGAGCTDTSLLRTQAEWDQWRDDAAGGFIVQPYIAGVPASLSLLCRGGTAWPLTLNRQCVDLYGQRFSYRGSIVGVSPVAPDLSALAQRLAAALPGLAGHVGIDLLVTRDGPMILEVNPRLTTSYAGIRRATGTNVAAAVLGLLQDPPLRPPAARQRRPTTIRLGSSSEAVGNVEKDKIPSDPLTVPAD